MGLIATITALVLGLQTSPACHPRLICNDSVRVARSSFLELLAKPVAVAGAVFLILAMTQPYKGWMQISAAPLRDALSQISRTDP
jgi:hypothetical protein